MEEKVRDLPEWLQEARKAPSPGIPKEVLDARELNRQARQDSFNVVQNAERLRRYHVRNTSFGDALKRVLYVGGKPTIELVRK